jgi:hypothetical protein
MAAMTDRPADRLTCQANTNALAPSLASRYAITTGKPSRRVVVRQHDVTRVLRAARSAGLRVFGYEVDPTTGKITVNTDVPPDKSDPETDLRLWRQKYGHKIYQDK